MSEDCNALNRKFNKAISEFDMLSGKKSVLVGLSGGADSVLLLSKLAYLKNIKVYAAHINHMIRGSEADRDERFCIEFCKKLNVDLFLCRIDIPDLSKKLGTGLEETARNERYSFFNKILKENNIDCIATAHNASDNAETILFNLSRGCSANGLCGIPPVRDNIIRPLIYCTKDEILSECEARKIEYIYDSTNSDTNYTRNFLRHKVIPLLKEINPSLESSLLETSSLLRADKEHFSKLCSSHSLSSGRNALSALDDALLGRVLINELKKSGVSPQACHISSAKNLLRSNSARFSLSMPGGTFYCDRNELFVVKESEKNIKIENRQLSLGFNAVSENSAIFLCHNTDDFSKDINKLKNIYKLSIHVSIDSAKINDVMFVRGRMSGDKYRYGGISHSVKKLFQSKKWTLNQIREIPIITYNESIVWIPFFPVSDDFKLKESGSSVEIFFFSNKFNHH